MDKGAHGILPFIGRWLRPQLQCSFCGRGAGDVARLVAGASAHICDACILKCVAVLEQHGGIPPPQTDGQHGLTYA
jgi:hypothetical protein